MKNENSNYILTSDGRFISEDELYHALSIRSWKESKNHKYISREWGKKGWIYKYPSDSNTKSTSKNNDQTQTKAGTNLLNTLSSYFKNTSSTMNKTGSAKSTSKSTNTKNLVSTGLKALTNATSNKSISSSVNASKSNKSSDRNKSITNNTLNKLGKTDISNVKVGSTLNKENASESKIGSLIEKGKTAFNNFIGITDKREAETAYEQTNLLKDAADVSQKDYNDARDNAYKDNDLSERERRSIAFYKKELDSINEKYSDALEKYEKENQEYLKSPLWVIENAAEKGKEFFTKLFEKPKTAGEKALEELKELQKEWDEEAEQKEQEKLRKEAEKEEAERKKKGEYVEAQTEERMTLRIPELYNLLKSLKKDNPLPDLPLKIKATTLDEDAAAVNPIYHSNNKSDYDENCGACTIAYDLRRRGYDVAAVDEDTYRKSGGTLNDLVDCYDNAKLIDMSYIARKYNISEKSSTGHPTKELVSCMEKEMLSEGDGARGNFLTVWSLGGGHSISWEVENGEIVYRDCQTNEKVELDKWLGMSDEFYYFRTDNLTPNERIEDYVQNYVRNR